MKDKDYEMIKKYVKSGPSQAAIAEMIYELVLTEMIRFSEDGTPYWTPSGEDVGAGDFE